MPFFCSTQAWSFFRYGLDRVSSMPCSLQKPINTSLRNSLPLSVSTPRNGNGRAPSGSRPARVVCAVVTVALAAAPTSSRSTRAGSPTPKAGRVPSWQGVVLGDGRVFFGTRSGEVIALTQETGEQVWATRVGSEVRTRDESVTTAPMYARGKVFVGLANGDIGDQGRVLALDAATGEVESTFFVVSRSGEFGHETWPQDNDSWEFGGASRVGPGCAGRVPRLGHPPVEVGTRNKGPRGHWVGRRSVARDGGWWTHGPLPPVEAGRRTDARLLRPAPTASHAGGTQGARALRSSRAPPPRADRRRDEDGHERPDRNLADGLTQARQRARRRDPAGIDAAAAGPGP